MTGSFKPYTGRTSANPAMKGGVQAARFDDPLNNLAQQTLAAIKDVTGIVARAQEKQRQVDDAAAESDYRLEVREALQARELSNDYAEKGSYKLRDGRSVKNGQDFTETTANLWDTYAKNMDDDRKARLSKRAEQINREAVLEYNLSKARWTSDETRKGIERTLANNASAFPSSARKVREEIMRQSEEMIQKALDDKAITAQDAAIYREKFKTACRDNGIKHLIYTNLDAAGQILATGEFEGEKIDQKALDGYKALFVREKINYDRRAAANEKAARHALVETALGNIANGNVPSDEFIASVGNERIQAGIAERVKHLNAGTMIATNPQVAVELNDMAFTDPTAFLNVELYEHLGELDDEQLAYLKAMQDSIAVAYKDSVEIGKDGRYVVKSQRTGEIKDSAYNVPAEYKEVLYGALVDKKAKPDEQARQKLKALTLFRSMATQTMMATKKQFLTNDERMDILNKITDEHVKEAHWYGDDTFIPQAAFVQGKIDDIKVDYDTISADRRERYSSMLDSMTFGGFKRLSAKDRKRFVERYAGVALLESKDDMVDLFKKMADEINQKRLDEEKRSADTSATYNGKTMTLKEWEKYNGQQYE